jgi:hypothetical protein
MVRVLFSRLLSSPNRKSMDTEGWWSAKKLDQNGEEVGGLFPCNYVELIDEDESVHLEESVPSPAPPPPAQPEVEPEPELELEPEPEVSNGTSSLFK